MRFAQTITVLALTAILAVITIPALAQQSSSPMTQEQQQPQAQPQAEPQAQPQTPDSQASATDMQTFQGTISRSKGQYVLMDSAGTASYKLDDQKKAKEFAGKSVKVTGTLNASGKVIHVASIEPAA